MTLPPMPDTDWSVDATWQYTDAQIRTYAEQAVAAESERWQAAANRNGHLAVAMAEIERLREQHAQAMADMDAEWLASVASKVDEIGARVKRLLAEPQGEPVAWHVCSMNSDGSPSLEFAAPWEELAHEHINDAILDDIDGASAWVVRPVYASPQPQQTEPSQDTPPQRPPTPTGWSDTDWIAHLAITPPIGYATRDHLYGTSAAGVMRFCPHDEPGAFAVYASPRQRMQTIELHEVRLLCGWFESMPDGAQDSQDEARFKAGQRYAASHIRAACECSVNGIVETP